MAILDPISAIEIMTLLLAIGLYIFASIYIIVIITKNFKQITKGRFFIENYPICFAILGVLTLLGAYYVDIYLPFDYGIKYVPILASISGFSIAIFGLMFMCFLDNENRCVN